ncbi:MAG: hypothetical protein MJ202_04215 [Lentisphaeria bacterium]|nr:hypothetical protein [Lentisphaeria bacterium]
MRKILFLLSCLAFTLLAGPKAQLIVPANETKTEGAGKYRFFRAEFDVQNKEIKHAIVCYVVGGSGAVALNEKTLGSTSVPVAKMYPEFTDDLLQGIRPKNSATSNSKDVTSILQKGQSNAFAISANYTASGYRGIMLHLLITFKDNTTQEFFSDTANWKYHTSEISGWKTPGFNDSSWHAVTSEGDCTTSTWLVTVQKYDMVFYYAQDDAATEYKRRTKGDDAKQEMLARLEAAPTEKAEIFYNDADGGAYFKIGGKLYRPVLYNCSDGFNETKPFLDKLKNFVEADIKLISFSFEAETFWTGDGQYNYTALDNALKFFYENTCIDENGFNEEGFETRFLVAITFCHGPNWWTRKYGSDTVEYARIDAATPSNDCIGNYSIHSFASERWIQDSTETVRKFVEHIENSPYGKHVFGYRLGDGVYSEWCHFGMDTAMPDVSAPMSALFRNYLRGKYGDDVEKLRAAWDMPRVTFENALPPPPEVRLEYLGGSYRDPRNAWSIDFLECLMLSQKQLLLSMNKAAKEACNGRALVGNYCGYFYGMGYPAEGCYLMNDEILASPYVDFQISPCCYASAFRQLGGSQLMRSLAATYRLHNKLSIFEADSRTHLANKGSKFATNLQEDLATLSRDLAQGASSGCAYWYYDFGEDWYNDDEKEIFQFFHKIAPVYDAIKDFRSSAEIAIVGDFESCYYHAVQDYNGGLASYIATSNQTMELNHAGVVFDSYSFADIDNPALQNYKVYVFPQLFYMTPEKLTKLSSLKKPGKTLVFLNAAGWLTPDGPSQESVIQTTGINVNVLENSSSLNTTITTGANTGKTMKNSGHFYPVLQINDSQASVRGTVIPRGGKAVNSFAVKKNVNGEGWNSCVCSSPFITANELREILVKDAGVHSYCNSDKGIVYANNSMIAFHTATAGTYALKAKKPVKWKMVYPTLENNFSDSQSSHSFTAPKADTYIFVIEP